MRVFLLDLWLDLRAKRLAPLAILLLAAIIAVPLIIAKGTSNSANTQTLPTATTAKAPAAPVIESQVQAGTVQSKLQTFSPRDPFEPTAHVAATTTGSSTTTSGGGSSSTKSTTTTGSSGTSGSSGGGGGAPTGTAPTGNGNGTGTGTNGTGNTTGQTKTTLFTYTVDVRLGQAGSVKAYKDVKRLDLLPTPKNPKLVFLGVTTTGKTAVFLVDSNIGVDTPGGKCRPSKDNCTFLYLRPDAAHDQATLTDSDGTVYHLRLLAIHRVSISSANGGTTNSGSGTSGSGTGGTNRSKAFTGNADSTSSADSNSVPGDSSPPGEPNSQSNFQQFFADGSAN